MVLAVKNAPASAGDARHTGLIPGSGRSPGVENGNPLQYSCLEKFHGQRSLAGWSMGSQSHTTEHACILIGHPTLGILLSVVCCISSMSVGLGSGMHGYQFDPF